MLQDRDLDPGMWTRGHRSAPSRPEDTAIYESRMSGAFPCVPPWHKRRALSPWICDTITSGNSGLVCGHVRGSVVSLMRVALYACVLTDDQHTLAMPKDAMRV